MKAVVFNEHGGTDKLDYIDVDYPSVGYSQALVEVRAAGANYTDVWARRGMPGLQVIFPHISGSDASGVVVEVAEGVSDIKVGDEVLVHPAIGCQHCVSCAKGQEVFCKEFKIWGFQTGPQDGGHSEYVSVPVNNLVLKPKSLSWEEAASLPLVLETAWRMLVTKARIGPGDFVLIWGASGGLGTMAVQICKLFNALPIAIVSSEEKAELVRQLGADYVVNRNSQNVAQEVRRITEKRGVDVVFEHVGQETWPTSIQCLRWGGCLVICGATTGFEAHTDLRFVWNKQLTLMGSHMGSKWELLEALSFVESGNINPVISHILPLQDVPKGQDLMEQNEVVGKIVYVP